MKVKLNELEQAKADALDARARELALNRRLFEAEHKLAVAELRGRYVALENQVAARVGFCGRGAAKILGEPGALELDFPDDQAGLTEPAAASSVEE